MTPFVDDTDFALHVGDALSVLRGLPDESVHCCVTSPPYWGLRDYGTGSWEGGDEGCDHSVGGQVQDTKAPGAITTGQRPGVDASRCRKCGARRVDNQLGLEPTPEEYVANMVAVFREVRRVLRRDGTCFLNLGDSYCSQPNQRVQKPGGRSDTAGWKQNTNTGSLTQGSSYVPGLKPKDLIGVPWRVAFALQADGWYLRSDIIWSKPNPMPESVTDRPTKAHEYLFLLSKSKSYFYDADAIRESAEYGRREWSNAEAVLASATTAGDRRPDHGVRAKASVTGGGVKVVPQEETLDGSAGEATRGPDGRRQTHVQASNGSVQHRDGDRWPKGPNRNRRSVWEIATEPYPDAHFATFPQALVEPCVKAGCPVDGTVLDPFLGSGTTALVARRLGRRSIGIELSAEYAQLAARRLQQLSLLAAS